MSDHIAHLGICDDTFRLARLHPRIAPTFKELMDSQREPAYMGCITRFADKFSAQLIADCREVIQPDEAAASPGPEHAGDGHQDDDRSAADSVKQAQPKLAFVLGSLTHRAADRLTKPITRYWNGQDDAGPSGGDANESKIIQDIFVFRELYGQGRGEEAGPFPHSILDVPTSEAQTKFESFLRLHWQRALIAMHTLKPDPEHMHDWLSALFDHLQTYPKSLEQYAQLNAQWDPAKVKKYLTDMHFYDRQDPIIKLAREIHHAGHATAEQVVDAQQATSRDHSRYARALARALDYLEAASELFNRKIDIDQAKQRFDVGVPELAESV